METVGSTGSDRRRENERTTTERGRVMDCKKCQYHTADGRCLYYIGCPYKPTPNEPTLDDLLEFEAEALGYRKFGKAEEGE